MMDFTGGASSMQCHTIIRRRGVVLGGEREGRNIVQNGPLPGCVGCDGWVNSASLMMPHVNKCILFCR